ncbi:MAG: bifunctional phosphoserine phosphatase/homoserine phosphotransferase ThrH [Deltaproteobacteria bacterium]|nr:bifunctional phosphoserine phosphatase/homoserine phosphotransferase ThrH [Deltaproteobacteria bacterium]
MYIVCADLEGVFVPEIWINVAEKTGISELRLTTRDISDYDVLMTRRISILKEHGLKIKDITAVISTMNPLEGAMEFLNWLRATVQLIVVSDTFVQFAGPLMEKLGQPTLFCNTLSIDSDGTISGYHLRQEDGKKKTVSALKSLNFRIIGVGDSYNDITMLKEADKGVLFRPPENVASEFPELPITYDYEGLKNIIEKMISNNAGP